MRAEKTGGAKFALYDADAEFDEFARGKCVGMDGMDASRATLSEESYIVAVGERLPPDPEAVYVTDEGDETTDPKSAMKFDTYGDALKWAVENCAFSGIGRPVPRGFERPRFPRVCYLRTYTEVTEC